MSTIIHVKCVDQRLKIVSAPAVFSGGVNEDFLSVEFCELWDGYTKTAVFYRTEKEVYHVVLDKDNKCVIPWEVLRTPGHLYLSVFGCKDDTTRTSEVIRYTVKPGAITEATKPSEPSPNIYEQLLKEFIPAIVSETLGGVTAQAVVVYLKKLAPTGYALEILNEQGERVPFTFAEMLELWEAKRNVIVVDDWIYHLNAISTPQSPTTFAWQSISSFYDDMDRCITIKKVRLNNDDTVAHLSNDFWIPTNNATGGNSPDYVVVMGEDGAQATHLTLGEQTFEQLFEAVMSGTDGVPPIGKIVFMLGVADDTQPVCVTTEYSFVFENGVPVLVCTYPTPDGLRVYRWSASSYSYELVPLGGGTSEYIETPLSVNEVRRGRYNTGVFDPAAKAICTVGFVKPFVVSAALTSADYRYCVTVYNNGAYVRTEGWLDSNTVYEFDHSAYQYKLYIGRVDNEYIYDLEDCINSVKLVISTGDILKAYNALEVQSDTERRNTKNALEYAMRRNYDISYANAPAPLNLITYAGDNQIVHPKVLYFPNKFNRHRFWIAYNPYPRANAFYENPCVAYSDDGYEWTNIPANPLDDPGELGINTDVHLVYVESKNRLEIWWRYADNKDDTIEVRKEIIYRRTSTDGFNWSEKETVLVNDSGDTVQYLSPCILHDGNKYRVWVVNDTEGIVKYYEGLEETGGTAAENIALNDTDLLPGAVLVNGNIEENENYKHTEKIKLSASKTFSLTGKNKNGVPYHIPIRRIVAYDVNGNILSDYNINTNIDGATISSTPTRPIVMNEAVDSVVLTLYQPEGYTEKTLTLEGVEGGTSGLSFVRDIPLAFPDDGKSHRLWHIDVIEDNGKTVMLPMCRARDSSVATEQTWSLFLCTSEDNITYTDPTQVIVGNPYGWDKQIYRSSIVNVDGEYRIYYTAQNEIQQHGLGVCTSRTLSNFVGKW